MKVVGNLTVSNPNGISSSINYSFSDAQIHLQGLGFMGFKRVEAINTIDGSSVESFYSYEVNGSENVFSPWLQKQIIRKSSSVESVTETTMEPIGGSLQQKFFLHVAKTIKITDMYE